MQVRATKTGSVPLHEAAEYESVDCVRVLLSLGAPAHPRNTLGHTAVGLAKKMNFSDIFDLLVMHEAWVPRFSLKDYYHNHLDRLAAQTLLLSPPNASSGCFLLRQSSRKACGKVLSLVCKGQVFHYEIVKESTKHVNNPPGLFLGRRRVVLQQSQHKGVWRPLPYQQRRASLPQDVSFLTDIDDGPYFTSLETLVDHYLRLVDGLPCRLQTPLGPSWNIVEDATPSPSPSRSPVYAQTKSKRRNSLGGESTEMLLAASPPPKSPSRASLLPHMDRLHHSAFSSQDSLHSHSKVESLSPMAHDLIDFSDPGRKRNKTSEGKTAVHQKPLAPKPQKRSLTLDLQNLSISSGGEGGTSPTMDGNRTDEILGEIDVNHLNIRECLGYGEFGSVLKGVWLSPSGDKIDVAVKTLHEDNKVNKKSFLKEARVMMNLNHMYIVKLVGVCHGPPVAMVTELMSMGSLLDLVLEHEEDITVDFHHKIWAAQIAEGMMYLEQKHFVHCDLAARNILLASMTLVKISDFGLTRALGVDKDYYTAKEGGKWPLKWYAPESIYYGTFTHSSDMWSYGVTLWETYTFGDQPYGDIPGKDVVALLERSERLPKPEKCSKGVYELMLRCWNYKPKERPAFREVAAIFRTQPEYINIKPYFNQRQDPSGGILAG
ncbi:Tyrosine-protein kinase HTK16 [Chionoecetes opilio]|uniref:Tyrosine-protein kinase n=1 Tax=Chionoecetes opilio TaxID=41210 RepID=A0A8J4YNP8_CHIOP|nr:Tyrosine-protein kinase HTK16 [Chionoecetes opilio]